MRPTHSKSEMIQSIESKKGKNRARARGADVWETQRELHEEENLNNYCEEEEN
jgi:hypothetical protein